MLRAEEGCDAHIEHTQTHTCLRVSTHPQPGLTVNWQHIRAEGLCNTRMLDCKHGEPVCVTRLPLQDAHGCR